MVRDEICPESHEEDGTHCDCWWNDTAACCWCGADEPADDGVTARAEALSDRHERLHNRDGKVEGVDR